MEIFTCSPAPLTDLSQAKKFGALADDDDDDSTLDEDSLFDSPLDKLEPYVLFRESLLSKFRQPRVDS